MPLKIVMPQLGESVHEGTLGRWLKKEGDPVKEYEPLLEVTTDKVDTEVTASGDGVLAKIEVAAGTTVAVGAVLGWINQSAEEQPAHGNGGHPAGRGTDLGFISPVVAKLASEHRLDLTAIPGTGLGGRITKKDVLAYVAGHDQPAPVQTPPAAPPTAEPPAPLAVPFTPLPSPAASDTVVPLSTMRRAIADHMVRSKHVSPHVTTVFEADLARVVAHRDANKGQFERDGVHLTYTAYFLSAAVTALKACPAVNSVFADDRLLLKREINIGLAVSLGEDGLIVPVVKNADEKSLLALARAANDLAGRARARQLKPEEVAGGTFTLTNHGVSGSLFATPIINQPQCGILGVGAIQKRVTVVNDAIAIRPMCYVSLTFDHRSLDGATADAFLAVVKRTLEGWA